MKTPNLSPRLIASIVHDIDSGRPIWGMLRTNEVVPAYHPLHRALAERAARRLTHHPKIGTTTRILRGALLHELTRRERTTVLREPYALLQRPPYARSESHRQRRSKVRELRLSPHLNAQKDCA